MNPADCARVLPSAVLPPAGASDWHCTQLSAQDAEHVVAEYVLRDRQTRRARRRLIAKWYEDALGASTFERMQALAGALRASGAGTLLAVPQPIAFDPAQRLLLQERAAGTRYQDLMGRRSYRRHARSAGTALAELHALPAAAARPKRMGEHMAELMRPHPLRLAQAMPELGQRVEALVAALLRAEYGCQEAPAAWLHRDFHLGQLIRGRGRLWVLDWDLAAHGDPALDVGNFLAALARHLGARAPAARAAFLEGYVERADPAIVRRAPLYEAFNWLRRACKAYRRQPAGWLEQVAAMLAAGERCLAQVQTAQPRA